MDWGKLITDNFDKLLVIVSTILGGILGGGITYFVQAKLQERQRVWSLDDQRREWKRSQIKIISEQTNALAAEFFKREWSLEESAFEMTLAEFIVKVDTSFDTELDNIIHQSWIPRLTKVLGGKKEERNKMLKEFKEANFMLQSRVNKLVEETYSTPPSLFQLLTKHFQTKRK